MTSLVDGVRLGTVVAAAAIVLSMATWIGPFADPNGFPVTSFGPSAHPSSSPVLRFGPFADPNG